MGKTIVVEHQPTIFVVDDDADFSDSLTSLLKSMGYVTSCHATGEEFLSACNGSIPGCVILDLKLPGLDGFRVLEALSKRPHALPAIILTGVNTVPNAVRAMRLGVVTFLQKQTFSEESLWEAIQQALSLDGDRRAARDRQDAIHAKLSKLTEPEKRVFDHMLHGKEQTAVAKLLGVSRRTVENRRKKVMEKLDVKTLPELIALAVEAELVSPL